jgi:ABC-type phosphate transport system substrate-binding protein
MRSSSLAASLLLAPTIVLGSGAMSVALAADEFVVVAHPSVAGANIKRADLAAVFLRKAMRWGGGGNAVPVDQSATSPVRRSFSAAVVGQSAAEVVQYWQKLMFSSSPLRPPPVKKTDAEVLAFVAATPGAVGYVSTATALPAGVKTLALAD